MTHGRAGSIDAAGGWAADALFTWNDASAGSERRPARLRAHTVSVRSPRSGSVSSRRVVPRAGTTVGAAAPSSWYS
nr:hypothetical protein GCM10020092_066040 [Actinoplanes digitatis]